MQCIGTHQAGTGNTSADAELNYRMNQINTHRTKSEFWKGVFLIGGWLSKYHLSMVTRHSDAYEFIHRDYLGE